MSSTAAPLIEEAQTSAVISFPFAAYAADGADLRALQTPSPARARSLDESPKEHYPTIQADVVRALDLLCDRAVAEDYADLTSRLMDFLELLKSSFGNATWRNAIVPAARAHRITTLIHECPFTSQSFRRPRGYPGDAALLDFVYRHPASQLARESATAAGQTVMTCALDVAACEAVRQRRAILASKIDEAAARWPEPEVFVVACGNLREAELSIALAQGKIKRLLATDQDIISLSVVDEYKKTISSSIETQCISVRDILSNKINPGEFHLIYAAGLYDYLDQRTAARLTAHLFRRLRPGGKILIPNFLWGVKEEAYMETYMDWQLLYRTKAEVLAFCSEIPSENIHSHSYYEDVSGSIGYLEVERKLECRS